MMMPTRAAICWIQGRAITWMVISLGTVALLLAACASPGSAPSPSPTTSPTTAASCAGMPPVYHPARLKVLQACVTFRGSVLADLHEKDGDRHLWLSPDPGYESFLNAANLYKGHKALVAEIVPACVTEPANEAAAATCPASKLGAPIAGSHIEITGRWVLDTVHGWQEVHPVASLKVLPRVSLGFALPSPGNENADE